MSKFEIRVSGFGPAYVGSYEIGGNIDYDSPSVGDNVSVKCKGTTIVAKLTEIELPAFVATILFFENYHDEELEGMRAGDSISFNEENAFEFKKKD